MARKKIEDTVSGIVFPIAERHGFELVDVEFVKEGANWYLRVYIDKPGGIMIDDCQLISEKLSEKLDEMDPIEHSYFLEVSSPGLERPLKKDMDFVKYKGESVEVKVFQPLEGRKIFEGELLGLVDDKISIKQENSTVLEFEKEKVASVKRVIKF